jgi:hypothetical protein
MKYYQVLVTYLKRLWGTCLGGYDFIENYENDCLKKHCSFYPYCFWQLETNKSD